MVRTEDTADDSLAAIFARNRFGMAIAAMIRMIATTISNSIREKPRCFLILSPSNLPPCRRAHPLIQARKMPSKNPQVPLHSRHYGAISGAKRKREETNFLPFAKAEL